MVFLIFVKVTFAQDAQKQPILFDLMSFRIWFSRNGVVLQNADVQL